MARDYYKMLRDDILTGKIGQDGRLPTFRVMMRTYDCSIATIKRTVDKLKRDGILSSSTGRATYITGSENVTKIKLNKHIGGRVLTDSFAKELDAAKNEFLEMGWIFSTYCINPEQQSSERELMFLQKAREQFFSSVVIEASPHHPTNDEMFEKMRKDGIKIVHLAPYKSDMSNETAFLPDYEKAGMLFAARAGQAAYQRIVCLVEKNTPFIEQIQNGLRWMAEALDLECLNPVEVTSDDPALQQSLDNLPEKTALLCTNASIGARVQNINRSVSMQHQRNFGLASLTASSNPENRHSYIGFDHSKIIHEALAFATDADRSSYEQINMKFAPCFVDCHTL